MEIKNVFNIIAQVINCTPDGEILEINDFSRIPIGSEDPYLKCYLDSVEKWATELKPTSLRIFIFVLKFLNYGSRNEIVLLREKKQFIAEKFGISVATIEKAIQELKKKNFLINISRATYILNPDYFGIGPWKEIKALRLARYFGKKGINVEYLRSDAKYIYLESK